MGQEAVPMAAEWIHVGKLNPWDANPRKIPQIAIRKVKESIQRFGWGSPIVARRSDLRVVVGHCRRLAYLSLLKASPAHRLPDAPSPGMVPVRFGDWSDSDAAALALADNRLNEEASWDTDALGSVLASIRDVDDAAARLAATGFEDHELRALIKRTQTRPLINPIDEIELNEEGEADSKVGTLYELGPHRLICGDCSHDAIRALVLNGRQPDLVWTDPPYGVSYEGGTKAKMKIQNDDLKPDALEDFLRLTLRPSIEALRPGASWYVAHPAGPISLNFAVVLKPLGWSQTLIWIKDRFAMGRSKFHYRHEPIYFGTTPGGRVTWNGGRTTDSVLACARPHRNDIHPTMKPVELVQTCVELSSNRGDLVFDPFGGGGSTLMACAISDRACSTIELSPHYADAIRRRWTTWATQNNVDPGPGALR